MAATTATKPTSRMFSLCWLAATAEAMRIVSPGSGTPKFSKKISSPTAMSP
jgi:hypothetical protein